MYGKKEGKKRNCHASLKKDCEPGFGLKPHKVNIFYLSALGHFSALRHKNLTARSKNSNHQVKYLIVLVLNSQAFAL